LISPYGTDNLTVPLSASFIYYLMTLYWYIEKIFLRWFYWIFLLVYC
jgi:hypothetical protein